MEVYFLLLFTIYTVYSVHDLTLFRTWLGLMEVYCYTNFHCSIQLQEELFWQRKASLCMLIL
jgi:hypothetical protein